MEYDNYYYDDAEGATYWRGLKATIAKCAAADEYI